MKKQPIVNEFIATINNKEYVLDIRKLEVSKAMPSSIVYSCMTFDKEMVPFKRFKLVYNLHERSFWAWTGDVIREEDRMFREDIAKLLNEGVLKLAS